MRSLLVVAGLLLIPLDSAVAQVSLQIGLPAVQIGINQPVYPQMVRVPGYPVYYAPNGNSNYFFYDGMYWVYQGDNWYASSWFNGPWAQVAPQGVPDVHPPGPGSLLPAAPAVLQRLARRCTSALGRALGPRMAAAEPWMGQVESPVGSGSRAPSHVPEALRG